VRISQFKLVLFLLVLALAGAANAQYHQCTFFANNVWPGGTIYFSINESNLQSSYADAIRAAATAWNNLGYGFKLVENSNSPNEISEANLGTGSPIVAAQTDHSHNSILCRSELSTVTSRTTPINTDIAFFVGDDPTLTESYDSQHAR
jgi:hypothetical protein